MNIISDITHMIIVCNPNTRSLNVRAAHHICHVLSQKSIQYQYIYLDEMNFNPLLSLEEIKRRASFDESVIQFHALCKHIHTLVLLYPDWYGFPPALLVGWIQRVLIPGVAFVYEEDNNAYSHAIPLLTHIRSILAVTSDEPDIDTVRRSCDLITTRVFKLAGISNVEYSILHDARNSSTHAKQEWITHTANVCSNA